MVELSDGRDVFAIKLVCFLSMSFVLLGVICFVEGMKAVFYEFLDVILMATT